MKTTLKFTILSLFVALLGACENDNKDKNETELKKGSILISSSLPNPDGLSGSAFIQIIDNLTPAHYDNSQAYPAPFSSPINKIGNDIYVLPGWGMETNALQKYSFENGNLVKKGEYLMQAQSGATNIVIQGEKAYISCALQGKIEVINHESLTKITEIDITSYGIGDKNPDPGCMIIREDLLYVGLNQMVGGYYPALDRPSADVLIINIKTDEVVKMITESTSGMSMPTRPFDPNSIFMDESNHIYVVATGGFGALPNHNTGILRIKAGETEFDKDYKFLFKETVIEGEPNKASSSWYVKYAGNGKLYATLKIPAYESEPADYIGDRNVMPAEIDINTQTIKKLDIPMSNSFSGVVGMYKDQVIFGLSTSNDNGYYTYTPSTGTASEKAIITTDGYPSSYKWFGE